jgi:hypothetical protein
VLRANLCHAMGMRWYEARKIAMQTKLSWVLAALMMVVLASTDNGWAITIRHDRSDSLYTSLADNVHPYGGKILNSWLGSGTLISPNWVLTAGHALSGNSTFHTVAGAYNIDQEIQHPTLDIGLAHLSSPVTAFAPVKLYDMAFGLEDGQPAIIMGAGATGTGLTGQVIGAGVRRAAQTNVHANGAAWGWGSNKLITYFRSPANGGADLEGGSTNGDSGGGLLLNVNGEYAIAGVLSFGWWGGAADLLGKYDTGGAFFRTAPINDWILQYATDAEIVGGSGSWGGPPLKKENFNQFPKTTWTPAAAGQGWRVSSENSAPANSHRIADGSNGNVTNVYTADSSSDGQNMLAYWDQAIPDASAVATKTTIDWQMTDGYAYGGGQSYRIGMSRVSDVADYFYTWDAVFQNNHEGTGDISGTLAVYGGGDEWNFIDIPGGDSWEIDQWYTLEVEEDNAAAGQGNGQMSRVRFGELDGQMGDWTQWVNHWADMNTYASSIRTLTNGISEFDNITMTDGTVILGDVNRDGQIDGLDMGYIGAYWQISGTDWITGDLNGDGITNGLDLNILGENWQVGVPAPGQTIPEPTTLTLLGLGAIAVLRRRQNTRRPDNQSGEPR